jgi:MFS family permease
MIKWNPIGVTMSILSRLGVFLEEGNTVSLVLLFNTLSWFLIGAMMIEKISKSVGLTGSPISSLVYYISIILSAIVGAKVLSKVHNQKQVFYGWLVFGSVSSMLPIIFIQYSPTLVLFSIALMGASLGIGFPSCLAYFTYSLPIEKKGRTAGLILILAFASKPLISFLINPLDLVLGLMIFGLWRGWSLLFLIKTSFHSFGRIPRKQEVSFFDVFSNRQLYLYFIAWLMFSFVDGFGSLFLKNSSALSESYRNFLENLEAVVAAVSAVTAGFISDWTGRKRVLIFGFVSLGLAYATLGIFTLNTLLAVIFYIIDGIAIGLLWVIFSLVLWGEVATSGIEKYYAIGEAPFFLTQMISTLVNPYSKGSTSITGIFSLAAFFLFIAVIPLLYAGETLPQRKIEERQLKIYTEEALKIKQKAEKKR